MTDRDEITGGLTGLYRRICEALDTITENGADLSGAQEIVLALRSLAVELGQLMNIEDQEYSPESLKRIRAIEREIFSLLGRGRAITESKSQNL